MLGHGWSGRQGCTLGQGGEQAKQGCVLAKGGQVGQAQYLKFLIGDGSKIRVFTQKGKSVKAGK